MDNEEGANGIMEELRRQRSSRADWGVYDGGRGVSCRQELPSGIATTMGAPCSLADDEDIRSSSSATPRRQSNFSRCLESFRIQLIPAAAGETASTELSQPALEGELELIE